MIRKIALGLAGLALACGPAALQAQPSGTPGKPDAGLARARLLSQCPAPLDLSDAEAAKLPIHVVEWGTAGPSVLVIHGGVQGGLGGGPDSFANQKVLAEQSWHLALPERPGFGQSPSRGPDNQEKDAVWIADMLGDYANLIGHSWGGADLLLAAARRPDAVRSLILVEPALLQLLQDDPKFRDDPRVKQGAIMPALLLGADTPKDFAINFARSLGAATAGARAPNAAETALEANPDRAARVGCALLQAKPAPNATLRQAAETLKGAKVPVLVITGGWSPSFDAMGDMVADLTDGRHVIVPSPNHSIMSSNPTGFNDAITSFMRQVGGDRGSVPAFR
jgi:pimeloyl-ACP methyl ester carboxylesterase